MMLIYTLYIVYHKNYLFIFNRFQFKAFNSIRYINRGISNVWWLCTSYLQYSYKSTECSMRYRGECICMQLLYGWLLWPEFVNNINFLTYLWCMRYFWISCSVNIILWKLYDAILLWVCTCMWIVVISNTWWYMS